MRRIPEARDFYFYWSALPYVLILLILIVVMAWFPAWWRMGNIARKMPLIVGMALFLRLEILIPLVLGIVILFLLFGNPVFSIAVGVGA